MENSVSLKKYIVIFSISIIVISIILNQIDKMLNHHSSISSFIAISWGSATFTSYKFIKLNNRIPNNFEKNRLIWYSIIAFWCTAIFFSLLKEYVSGNLYQMFDKLNYLSAILILIVVAVQYFIFSFSYGNLADMQLTRFNKKIDKKD